MAILTFTYPPQTINTTGLATSANQTTQIGLETSMDSHLASLDTNTPTVGQKTMAASSPVVIASDQSAIAVTGPLTNTQLRASDVSVLINNSSVPVRGNGQDGTAATLNSLLIAGSDGTTQRNISTDSTGKLQTIVSSTVLPTGASTSALQTTGNTSLSSIDTKTPALVSGRVPVDGSGVTQPISATALPLPTGASTSALQTTGNTSLSSIDTKVPANLTVTSTRLLVDGSGVTQPVSGTVTVSPLTNSSIVKAQLQDNAGTAVTVGQKLMASSLPVVIASDQNDINVAATKVAGSAILTGNGVTGGGSMRVTIASDNTPFSVNSVVAGKSKVNLARNDYGSTAVTTAAYVQLIASTSTASNLLELFDSSGQTLVLAVGGAGAEVDQLYINPGGNGQVPLNIPSGSRVSIKAVTATASSGYINLTLYS